MENSGEILAEIRRKKPLIHQISNYVTLGDCAQVISNTGALPVMAHSAEEVEEITAASHALLLNTGTLSPERFQAMLKAGDAAKKKGIPVVLDPVGVGATSFRTKSVNTLLVETRPTIIKGNFAEISSAAGIKAEIRGVHSLPQEGQPSLSAASLLSAVDYPAVVVVTGQVDFITDGKKEARVYNGHPVMPQLVGSGCMAGSLCTAFAALCNDPFYAAIAAFTAVGVAAEIAAAQVKSNSLGPTDFKQRFLDALFFLSPSELDRQAKVEIQ